MVLNDDLRYFSYERRGGHLLTEKGRERRLEIAKKLLNLLKHPVEPGTAPNGAVEQNTNRTSSNTMAELMVKIRSVFAALPREIVARACSRFRRQVEAVIEAEGGYFE
uniref:Uncharacterized protein n=1 Tax=Anopheles quadriannulatus TaxID=34691 RepID=A0A182X300_ANOQN